MAYPNYPPRLDELNALWKTLILLAVFIANYIHLQWTLKKPQSRWHWRVCRLVLALLMPSLATAQALVSLFNTAIFLLRKDTAALGIRANAKDWRRYFCCASGMYLVADPHAAAIDSEDESGPLAGPDAPAVKLISIDNPSDLRHHKRPWDAQVIIRVLLVVAAVPTPSLLGLIVDPQQRWPPYSLDRRRAVATIGNVTCSICALLVLICRSEWSLMHLITSAPKAANQYLSFTFEMVLGGIINETPYFSIAYWGYDTFWPVSFLRILGGLLFPTSLTILLVFAFWASVYRDEIAARSKLDWSLALTVLLTLLCIWIVFDLIVSLKMDVTLAISGHY